MYDKDLISAVIKFKLVLILLINSLIVESQYSCKKVNENLFKPCSCLKDSEIGLSVVCKNVTQWSTLRKSLNTLTIKKIENLIVEDLNEENFTNDSFKNYQILSF